MNDNYQMSLYQRQFSQFLNLAKRLNVEVDTSFEIVRTHSSQSNNLPVAKFNFPNGQVYLRDNLYNLEIVVSWNNPVNLTFDDVCYEKYDWDWYLQQIEKCENYSWQYWSKEEILDERITRVRRKPGLSNGFDEKTPDQKLRWINRMSDPTWFSKDWSSGYIYTNGALCPENVLYVGRKTYLEGITESFPRYSEIPIFEPGMKFFSLNISWKDVEGFIQKCLNF
jgi:hypothetical protein